MTRTPAAAAAHPHIHPTPSRTRTREPLLPGHDIDQKVEVVRLEERFCDVGARERAALVGVCDDEGARGYLGDEYLEATGEDQRGTGKRGRWKGVLSQALQKRIGAVGGGDEMSATHARYPHTARSPSAAIICSDEMHTRSAMDLLDQITHTHLHIRIALHNLLYSRQRQRRMPKVRRLLLGRVHLPSPERAQKVRQQIAGLHERRLGRLVVHPVCAVVWFDFWTRRGFWFMGVGCFF